MLCVDFPLVDWRDSDFNKIQEKLVIHLCYTTYRSLNILCIFYLCSSCLQFILWDFPSPLASLCAPETKLIALSLLAWQIWNKNQCRPQERENEKIEMRNKRGNDWLQCIKGLWQVMTWLEVLNSCYGITERIFFNYQVFPNRKIQQKWLLIANLLKPIRSTQALPMDSSQPYTFSALYQQPAHIHRSLVNIYAVDTPLSRPWISSGTYMLYSPWKARQ